MSGWDLLAAYANPVPSDVGSALHALGIEVIRTVSRQGSTELLARCPAHETRTGRPDRKPSFWVNSNSGASICFSCMYSASFTQLVEDGLGLTRAEATSWIIRRGAGARRRTDDVTPESSGDEIRVNEASLALFVAPPAAALASRRLSAEACAAHGVLWDPAADHWILPIRDDEGRLVGWQAKGGRYFHNHPPGVTKSAHLFGGHLPLAGTAILVESPLDAVRLTTLGIPGAVSSYGAYASEAQIRAIKNRARVLVLALDNDHAGRKAAASIYRTWRPRGLDMRLLAYGGIAAKDPGDMTDEEIHRAVDNAHRPFLRRKRAA